VKIFLIRHGESIAKLLFEMLKSRFESDEFIIDNIKREVKNMEK
jgi:hypothetical protein